MQQIKVSLLLLASVAIATATTGFVPSRPSQRSYAFSYASPDGKQSRYETSAGRAIDGGYKYVTPEGGLVAMRYSNDPSGERAPPLTATERRFSAATGALADPYGDRDPSRRPVRRHAFSYVLPDGQSRYESWEDGRVVGGYRYVSPDGTKVAVRYTAGEEGFRPVDISSEVQTGPLATGVVPDPTAAFPTARAALPVTQFRQVTYPTTPVVNPYYVWRQVDDDDDHDDWDDDDYLTAYRRVAYPVSVPAAPAPQPLPVYSYPTSLASLYSSPAYSPPGYSAYPPSGYSAYPLHFPYVNNQYVKAPYVVKY